MEKVKDKIKLWWKQYITCDHILQADNLLGWECMKCKRKATKWKHVYFTRWNGETKKEFEIRKLNY